MHKSLLAAVAAAALFAPAVAQQIKTQTGQDQQMQPQPIQGASQALAGQSISPQLLGTRQIRDIQQALEARGAHAMRMDGQWGPDVEAAIRNFQKSENLISQNGELDPLTLMALGLNPMSFGLSGPTETTGQAIRDNAAPREPAQELPDQPVRELPLSGEQDQ